MTDAVIGYTNRISTAALTASSAAVAMQAEMLQDDSGSASAAWQTASGDVSAVTLTITPSTTGLTWRAFGLFRTNLTSGASVTFALYENPSTLIWSATKTGPAAGYGQVVAIAGSEQTADYAVITITDAANPDGFLNIPLAYAGPVWIPVTGPTWQSTFGRDDQVDETVARGGQEYPVMRFQRRRWEVGLGFIETAELWSDAQELDRIARIGGNVLFAPDAASSHLQHQAIFGRFSAAADTSFVAGFTDLHAWRFRLRERL